MQKKGFLPLIALVVIIIILVIVFGFGGGDDSGSDSSSSTGGAGGLTIIPAEPDGGIGDGAGEGGLPESNDDGESETGPMVFTVEMTSSGFSPSTLEINAGDTVTWITRDSGGYWPASAVHPTHTVYPDSSIAKCGTAERDEIFDSCEAIGEGESYSFTFNEVGAWGYHDHLRASLTGRIIVN